MTLTSYQIELVHDALRLLAERYMEPDTELVELIDGVVGCEDIYIAASKPPYVEHAP